MRQFTIYAGEQARNSPEAAYVVAFTRSGPVVYAMGERWEGTAKFLERKLTASAGGGSGGGWRRTGGGS